MKIFSSAQIKACDAYTIHAAAMSSHELMERAAGRCADWIMGSFSRETLFIVLCGSGNNGGDGLAITRMLHQQGYGAKAFVIRFTEQLSADCELNLKRLEQIDPSIVETVAPETYITDIHENIVIIDAILGTGLNRSVEGWLASFIRQIDSLPNQKIAIDIPSGLPADNVPEAQAAVLRADHTLSFQFYKRTFLHPEGGSFCGHIHILDIGLNQTFIQGTHSNYHIITPDIVRSLIKPRPAFSHKGSFGTAMIIGGSFGMMGAAVLAARAASRAGAGKVRAQVPADGYLIMQSSVPEALCLVSGEKEITRIKDWEQVDAIGIGPGLGTAKATAQALETFLDNYKLPLVIDADALNILAGNPEMLHKIPAGSILTPHPAEFERLFGKTANTMLRLEHARTQAMRHNFCIVLKDRHTAVVTPEGECWYNLTGNAGLATGGSGDVLTGITTALLAQGYEPVQAAMLGVYLHGLAADLALESQSPESMIPQDVTDCLGTAFRLAQAAGQ